MKPRAEGDESSGQEEDGRGVAASLERVEGRSGGHGGSHLMKIGWLRWLGISKDPT